MLFRGLALTLALVKVALTLDLDPLSPKAATPTPWNAGVPTGIPVPGDYRGQWRPQVHFSPPSNFLNDPNGCFLDADGIWHLYYQCKWSHYLAVFNSNRTPDNPAELVAGNQHWGHATSKDLYT